MPTVILGGIRVGDNAKIGAGSVLIRDVPANAVVVGNQARVAIYITDDMNAAVAIDK